MFLLALLACADDRLSLVDAAEPPMEHAFPGREGTARSR